MPELPEIEVIKNSLIKEIKFSRINKIFTSNKKMRYNNYNNFEQNILNKTIIQILRHGKNLIIKLYPQSYLIFHLGMSGSIIIKNNHNIIQKHDHLILYLKNKCMIFNDPRRFGYYIYTDNEYKNSKYINNVGIEPLDNKFNYNFLHKKTIISKAKIKNLIMNNNIILGIGNIYANEILFLSKIHPESKSKNIPDYKIKKIINNTKYILKKSIKYGGTTIKNFYHTNQNKGSFINYLTIYGKDNNKCKHCKTTIQKILINNRSSFICSSCQTKY